MKRRYKISCYDIANEPFFTMLYGRNGKVISVRSGGNFSDYIIVFVNVEDEHFIKYYKDLEIV